MENENFPQFLYRALDKRKYAEDFVKRGYFRLGLIDYYREIEDSSRQDKTERESNYLFPCEKSLCHAGGKILGPIYLLCTSGPNVDLMRLRSKGQYIVKINDPKQFLYDLNAAKIEDLTIEITSKASFAKARYTKCQVDSIDPDSIEAIRLDYTQKLPSDAKDDEYRYIIFTKQLLADDPPNHIFLNIGHRLKYAECFRLTF